MLLSDQDDCRGFDLLEDSVYEWATQFNPDAFQIGLEWIESKERAIIGLFINF